jgi:hypothetical protein
MRLGSVVCMLFAASAWAEEAAISLSKVDTVNQATLLANTDGRLTLKTTGTDPYLIFKPLDSGFDSATLRYLIFDYKVSADGGRFQVFIGPGFTAAKMINFSPTAMVGTWGTALIDLSQCADYSGDSRVFRLDLGNKEGVTVELNHIRLGKLPREALAKIEEEKAALAKAKIEAVAKRGKIGVAVEDLPIPNRTQVAAQRVEPGAATAVVCLASQVDLDAQIKAYRGQEQMIARAPMLVTGQGPHPSNHTFIKVLGREGIAELCFLAFPPTVRGGVEVAVVHAARGGLPIIVATPLLDSASREVRLFSRGGALLRTVSIPGGKPPFAMGSWRKDDGQEWVAVASASSGSGDPIFLFDANGDRAGEIAVPSIPKASGARVLAGIGGKLAFQVSGQSTLHLWNGAAWKTRPLASVAAGRCYEGRTPEEVVVPGGSEVTSTIIRDTIGVGSKTLDAGARENLSWIAPQRAWGNEKGNPKGLHYETQIKENDFATNRYLRRGHFEHARVEPFGAKYGSNFEKSTNEATWTGGEYLARVSNLIHRYDQNPPALWEPTTTHRWPGSARQDLGRWLDAETGLPKYMGLSRQNLMPGYAEGTSSFTMGSYHYQDQPYAYCHWIYPLRANLRALAQKHRTRPEYFIALEPVHEMEVISEDGNDGSIGDYNPAGIRSFYQYLRCSYPDLAAINLAFGSKFTADFFDAPRDLGRGPWDAYDSKNPYFLAWWRFNMQVIYRVVSDAWREALLAGFPPEALTCHQIPDLYAIASLTAFTKPVPRVTPVDWMLTAGTGFGYTRYGTWFRDEHSMQKSAFTSGQGMVTLGEYSPLCKEAADAHAQYRALFENGAYAFHLMAWNPAIKPGANQAAFDGWQQFAREERPRPGVAGGVLRGAVHRRGNELLELVSLGTGSDRTGLIKSIQADGTWEGSVYTVPFHTAIAVELIEAAARSFAAGTTLLIPEKSRVLGGSQYEIRFEGTASTDSKLTLIPVYGGLAVESQSVTLLIPAGKRQQVIVYKIPLPVDRFALQVRATDGFSASTVEVLLEVEKAARPREGIFEGERARGGVTFAILE